MAWWERWRPHERRGNRLLRARCGGPLLQVVRRLPANVLRAATLGAAIISRNIRSPQDPGLAP
jgi:hypothetical protein